MYTYVTRDLREIVESSFPVDGARRGIFGHSMGGTGLVIGCEIQARTAASPPSPPSPAERGAGGQKAFAGYLGDDRDAWRAWDACAAPRRAPLRAPILIDQGTADQFLTKQLRPELFEAACAEAGQPLELARREGYDHGYFFMQSFMERHLRWHHERLTGEKPEPAFDGLDRGTKSPSLCHLHEPAAASRIFATFRFRSVIASKAVRTLYSAPACLNWSEQCDDVCVELFLKLQ